MSIPVHFNGSLLNIMGGGASGPAPPSNPITRVTILLSDEGFGGVIGQFYFGTGGATTGDFTSKATFLADNPGLTLQDFSGIAPANGTFLLPTQNYFSGFNCMLLGSPFSTCTVADSGFWATVFPFTPGCPFCSLLSNADITFTGMITAAGFNIAQQDGSSLNSATVTWYSGATVLSTQTLVPASAFSFTSFRGYVSS